MEVKTVTLLQPSLRVLYHPCSKIDQRGKIIASSSPDTELVLQSPICHSAQNSSSGSSPAWQGPLPRLGLPLEPLTDTSRKAGSVSINSTSLLPVFPEEGGR